MAFNEETIAKLKAEQDYVGKTQGYCGGGIGLADQARCSAPSITDSSEYRLNRLKDRFQYHAPSPDQRRRYQNLRDAALAFATVIVRNTPDNGDTVNALNALEATLMLANKAIALENVPLF